MKINTIKRKLIPFLACGAVAICASSSYGAIILVDEDFSLGAGAITGGNGAATFTAGGGVGSLAGNGADTFISIGAIDITNPAFALGGQLTFRVDNLGGATNNVTRWLQVDVDNANVFSGRQFGPSNDAALIFHSDVDGSGGTTTIAPGTTELDLLFVTTVDFGGTALPAGEIARLGSFYAEFTPAPEPSSALLVALGCLSGLGLRRRK